MHDFLGIQAAITSGECTDPDPTYAEKIAYWENRVLNARDRDELEHCAEHLSMLRS